MSDVQIEVLKWLAIFVFACGTACAMAGALFVVSVLAKTGVDNVLKAVAYANDLPHNFKKLRAVVRENDRLRAENERLLGICAAAYQLAGLVGAPERFLNALSRADNPQYSADGLLPVFDYEIAALAAGGE